MDKVETAVSCFKEGFSCSQAVLSAYSGLYGLNRELALKISQPFGGGIAHMGEICGAVTGAFLVIGLKYGRIKADDTAAKEKTYELVLEFVKRFKSLHGSIRCIELIEYDLSTPEGLRLAEEKEVFATVCPKFIQSAAQIVEQIV